MKRAGLHPAFADARQADEVFVTFQSLCHQCADGYRNHRAQMADHGEFVVERMTSMNVAVASAHWSQTRPKIRARHVNQRFAECGSTCLIANQWREDIAFLQKQTARDTDCLLAFADINSACDQATAIETNELFLKRTREKHPANRLEEPIVRRRSLVRTRFVRRRGRALLRF